MRQGGDPPSNKIRKVIFKDNSGLNIKEKLSIVGQLIGRKKISQEDIYDAMILLWDSPEQITISKIAKILGRSTRTIYRNMCKELKTEKQKLNEKI